MATDISQARLNAYDIYIDGEVVGVVKTGTTVNVGQEVVDLTDADQFVGVSASIQTGFNISGSFVMYQVNYPTLMSLIASGKVTNVVSGSDRAFDFTSVPVNLVSNAVELILRPTDSGTDYSSDIVIWKCDVRVNFDLMGDRTKFQEITVNFRAFPDTSRAITGYPTSATYMRIGDSSLVATDPTFIGIIAGRTAYAPYLHCPALTLDNGAVMQVEAFGAWFADAASTAAVNEAGNVTATQLTIAYDTKSTSTDYTGRYIKIGTERLYVSADSGGTAASGTWTVTRAAGFSTAATALDNAVVTLQDTPIVYRLTNTVTWASSVTADLTAGNSVASGTKGRLTHVSSGSSNVTAAAADATPTSKNLVVTTN